MKRTTFTFPARFYSRPEQRRMSRQVSLQPGNTVLLLRNASNMGYPGPLEPPPDSPHARPLGLFEHIPRMREVIDSRIVPLVETARRAGVRIMHVAEGWKRAQAYPQWRAVNARAPDPGPTGPGGPHSPNVEWQTEHEAEVFYPGFAGDLESVMEVIDFAPPLSPRPQDWVVTTHAQAALLLDENGVENILHAGFDTHNEVFYGAAGTYMFCRSYRGFLLRDCTAGLEREDTADDQALTRAAITVMELAVRCYTALGTDVRGAIQSAVTAGAPSVPPERDGPRA